MALIFQCNFCGTQYPAKLLLKGLVVDGWKIEKEDDPCENCNKIADEARIQALKEIKKKI